MRFYFTFTAVCPIPVIENGKVSPVDTTFTEGDQIDVSCDEGYSLKDDLNSPPMCLSNGTWDRVPRCIQNGDQVASSDVIFKRNDSSVDRWHLQKTFRKTSLNLLAFTFCFECVLLLKYTKTIKMRTLHSLW